LQIRCFSLDHLLLDDFTCVFEIEMQLDNFLYACALRLWFMVVQLCKFVWIDPINMQSSTFYPAFKLVCIPLSCASLSGVNLFFRLASSRHIISS